MEYLVFNALVFNATVSAHGPLRISVTTTPLERVMINRNIITVDELIEQYRIAIERGEYTTYGLA